MKCITKYSRKLWYAYIVLATLLLIVISCVKNQENVNENWTMIDRIKINFPIALNTSYEISYASIEDEKLSIVLRNLKTKESYDTFLDYNGLEEFVCNNQYYSDDNNDNQQYDCSNKKKTILSMIKEVGYQAIEMINEE